MCFNISFQRAALVALLANTSTILSGSEGLCHLRSIRTTEMHAHQKSSPHFLFNATIVSTKTDKLSTFSHNFTTLALKNLSQSSSLFPIQFMSTVIVYGTLSDLCGKLKERLIQYCHLFSTENAICLIQVSTDSLISFNQSIVLPQVMSNYIWFIVTSSVQHTANCQAENEIKNEKQGV